MSRANLPKVSVVIPCYNYARYLPDAIASVLAQTYDDWELIIVDDGSGDATITVAQRLIASFPQHRMQLFTQPNSGSGAARNTGARHARGEYLLFLDADDMLAPTFLECAITVMAQCPHVGFVYSGMQIFGQDQVYIPSVSFDIRTLMFANILLVQSLVRRLAWKQVGGFDTVHFPHGFEDWDFWLRVAAAGWSGYHIPAPLVYYRRHGYGLSGKSPAHEWDLRAQIIRKHPQLYGARLAAWATTRCARRGLAGALPPVIPPAHALLADDVAPVWWPAFTPPAPLLRRQSLTRQLIRAVPYRARFRVQCVWRRVQLALRATGFWMA